jgi:PAS domain S-box-containing protein
MKIDDFKILVTNIDTTYDSCLICEELQKDNYNVIEKNNIYDVYDYIENNQVDLIIVNDKDSNAKAQEVIHRINSLTNTNIIFLTNDANVKLRKNFFQYNLLDYKVKLNNLMYIIDDIKQLIKRLFDNSKEKILVIKKDNKTRDIIVNLLKQRCFQVEVVSNGSSGWKKIEKEDSFSLIIVDISLQDVKSSDIIKKAKEKYSNTLPILALTSEYDPLLMQENIAKGLSDFIKVPVIHEEFNLKVGVWINNVIQSRKLKEQEQKLKQTLNSFKALSNATMEGLIMFEDNICVDINEEALKLFKYEKEDDLIGKNILDIFSKNITQYDKDKLLDNNINHKFELEMLKSDGEEFPASIKERNIILENKQTKIIAVLDLTEIKRKEDMLAQQSKLASMGEMIGNIAHQWRQPLTSISISASNIKLNYELDMFDEEEFFELTNSIIESTEFLSNTINDFQSFLKGDGIPSNFTVQEVVKKVLLLVSGNIKSVGIEVIEEYKTDKKIFGIQNEFTQSLLNIINNARDALKEKELDKKYIFITSSYDEKQNKIIVSIKDNAQGIPKDVLPKIFEPYFTTKHQSQGTGLGLYMTHQMLVDNLHADVEVRNVSYTYNGQKHTGAEFIISIDAK